MNNRSIFNEQIFDLPISRGNADMYSFIDSIFNQYIKTIKKFDGTLKIALKSNLPFIEKECALILESLKLYLGGLPSDSYIILKKCLDLMNDNDVLEIQEVPSISEKNILYRVRIANNVSLNKKEIFHIPFNLREVVSTQRYSIPGLPSLYLGDSIFVCWEELGRPNFDQIHVSRYDISNSNFKLLYLNITANEMRVRCFKKSNDGKFINHLVKYLSYWPLLAACSVKVEKQTVFKPEYIIPQMVLQWIVSTKKLDGIQYKSNRVRSNTSNIGSFTNIVIPVKKQAADGYCTELLKKIKLTSPVSWQLFDISAPHNFTDKVQVDEEIDSIRRASYIELILDEKTTYLTSKFGILEEKLKSMNVSYIL